MAKIVAAPPVVDPDAEAKDVLVALLLARSGAMQRSEIAMAITKGYTGHPRREALRKRIFSEDFLGLEAGWVFDRSGKTQQITLA